MAKPATYTFDNVSLAKAGKQIIGPLSLTLEEKRIGIVGQNGSGKSTFARLLAGLIAPDSGQVHLDGVNLFKDRKTALAHIGVIFQNPDQQIIFPTVIEEIAFGLQQQGLGKTQAMQQAQKVLADHGRADWADRNTHVLSQGQRHYLCLMAVLAMRPSLIVLDEPYAGLDIPTSMGLHHTLTQLEQSLVMITHNPAALQGFDRVIWLENGQIKQDGPAAPVLEAFSAEMQRLGALQC